MTNLYQISIPSPVGDLTVLMEENTVILCEFSDAKARIARHLNKYHAGKTISEIPTSGPKVAKVVAAITAYFAGDAIALDGLKINASGSDFDKKIWAMLRTIPAGETWSYGDLAKAVGSHPRAVGGANGRNPVAIITPCHRVIGKDGTLTGYAGGVTRKQWLLELEGAI